MCICVWVAELPGQIIMWDCVICSGIISRYNRLPSLLGTWAVDASLLDKFNHFLCRSRWNKSHEREVWPFHKQIWLGAHSCILCPSISSGYIYNEPSKWPFKAIDRASFSVRYYTMLMALENAPGKGSLILSSYQEDGFWCEEAKWCFVSPCERNVVGMWNFFQ